MIIRIFVILSLSLLSSMASAWNGIGHEIIAQIAYTKLTPVAKAHIDQLSKKLSRSRSADWRFLRLSTWPDYIKKRTDKYDVWHYINLPFVKNNHLQIPTVKTPNVVWAIQYSIKQLQSSTNKSYNRAKYLAFLIHFMGDIHQPMHCITLYSNQYPPPVGDEGGNLLIIKSPIAHNLHQYWDRGLGLFSLQKGKHFGLYFIQKLARQWMTEYPRAFFSQELQLQFPKQWADESHHLAIQYAYADLSNQAMAQIIIQKQTVLAGYRLAQILNQLFSSR